MLAVMCKSSESLPTDSVDEDGVANVYFGLCHMAAHVTLLTPKDDSNLEVERTLAMFPPPPAPLLFIQRIIPNLTPSGICPR